MNSPQIPYQFFTEEQKEYLDQLAKFSGRTQRTRLVSSQAIPSKKYSFIKNNLMLMTVDEQFEFNEAERHISEESTISIVIGASISAVSMLYYISSKPLHQKLYGEMFKSGFIGLGVGLVYYQFRNYAYREEIHRIYVKLLAKKKLGIV